MKKPQTFIIIGNGVAAWRVNAELERKFIDAKILRIASDSFVPTCSFRSTAINCLRGTQKGISALGDLIVDSHDEFCAFMDSHFPSGIHKTHEYQIWDPDDQVSSCKWERRYGEGQKSVSVEDIDLKKEYNVVKNLAYLIDPIEFYKWHCEQFKNTQEINDLVVEMLPHKSGHLIKTHKGQTIYGDKVFLCAGHSSPVFSSLIKDSHCLDYLSRSKPVKGAYLYKTGLLERRNLSLALDNKHIIFRNGTIMIGSTSENGSSILYQERSDLREIYSFVADHLQDAAILPDFKEMKVSVGVRHKGPKRSPWWGECSENLYGVFGLYKNGFSFSFKAAKDLVSSIT